MIMNGAMIYNGQNPHPLCGRPVQVQVAVLPAKTTGIDAFEEVDGGDPD